ncbi:MAG: hypothetical protein WEB58_06360 [Planctomycetaceae bacterium]
MISTWTPESQSIKEMPERMKQSMSSSAHKIQETVESHPTAAVMISLGAGFAAGMMLACAYRHSSSSHFSKSHDSMAQRVGHRVMDSLRDVIPSNWMDRLHT